MDVVDRSDEWSVLSLVGPEVDVRWPGPLPPELHGHVAWDGGRVVRTAYGLDLVGGNAALRACCDALVGEGWPVAGPRAWEAFRIERGIPVQPADVDDSTIPQEAELERDAVSFTKGCFVGQELVCRIDSRGHVNRFLRRLVDLEGPSPSAGAEILRDGSTVGRVTSVAPEELALVALGYVRREVEPGACVVVRSAAGLTDATVLTLAG